MLSIKMQECLKGSSAIRAMFEEGKAMAAIYGAENVCDFSLGNPNLPPPPQLKQAVIDVMNEEEPTFVHGYMNNSGYEDTRAAIAASLNQRHGTNFSAKHIVMTVGAAGGLNVVLKCLINPGDEVVVFAPYFGEYNNYVKNVDAALVVVPPHAPDFQPDLTAFERCITAKTKAVIMNSPNNPTGVVYAEDTIRRLAEILRRKQAAFGTAIYLLSDEPYRELVYDGVTVPCVPNYYENTIVGYSWSKSLSLPGERIGYLAVAESAAERDTLLDCINVATRVLGFVNAPSIMQRAVMRCLDVATDVAAYDRNRTALYEGLTAMGYECVKPEGAFYLFVKSPLADDKAFCAQAKDYQLILVPGSAFACPGYVRVAYCVAYETIQTALPKFRKLMDSLN